MLVSLITRPLRIATRTATLPFRAAQGAADIAEGVVTLVLQRVIGGNDSRDGGSSGSQGSEPAAWRGPAASSTSAPSPQSPRGAQRRPSSNGSSATAPERSAAPSAPQQGERVGDTPPPTPAADAPAAPAAPPTPEPPAPDAPGAPQIAPDPVAEPRHISSEVELVEEVSEPGAEDGAGAQVHIAEPWDGYRAMKAADIVDRLASASTAEIAAVQLYEMAGRNRKSVMAAAERALKRASPPR